MRYILLSFLSAAYAFMPCTLVTRPSVFLYMSDPFDYGKKNDYVRAPIGDGGQGEFGARSPNDWRVPGTSPVGEKSYPGAADGGDEPWFAEAVSTVFLDLKKADETVKTFTKEAARFKIEALGQTNPDGWKNADQALEELTNEMGYDAFLEATSKQLDKAWKKLHPVEKKPAAKPKEKTDADKPKAKTVADKPKPKTVADKTKAKTVADKSKEKSVADKSKEKSVADKPEAKIVADKPEAKTAADKPEAKTVADKP